MQKDIVVCCDSQQEYDTLMEWAEENGYKWRGGEKPTQENYFCDPDMDEDTEYDDGFGILFTKDKWIEYSGINYYRNSGGYPNDISFEDFSNEYMYSISTIEF